MKGGERKIYMGGKKKKRLNYNNTVKIVLHTHFVVFTPCPGCYVHLYTVSLSPKLSGFRALVV